MPLNKAPITRRLFSLMIGILISPCTLFAGNSNNEVTIQILTSDWYPFAYLYRGSPKGSAYEIAKAVLDRSQMPYKFSVRPWARVYNEGLRNENYLIVGVGRTEQREKLFKWIGPVQNPQSIYFYTLSNSRLRLSNITGNEATTIGVERSSYSDEYLSAARHKAKVFRATRLEQLVKMTVSGRLDLFLLSETRLKAIAKSLDIRSGTFKQLGLAFTVTNYMAFGPNTSDAITNRLKQSYELLESEGKLSLH